MPQYQQNWSPYSIPVTAYPGSYATPQQTLQATQNPVSQQNTSNGGPSGFWTARVQNPIR